MEGIDLGVRSPGLVFRSVYLQIPRALIGIENGPVSFTFRAAQTRSSLGVCVEVLGVFSRGEGAVLWLVRVLMIQG